MRCPSLAELPSGEPVHPGWPWTGESQALPPVMLDGTPWPCVSIVTPSFNQGQYIEETIRSVLLQGYPNMEYIVIDGGSTDHSVDVIKKYEQFISFWVSEPDKGQAHAINKGWKHAQGEIFAWLNSDDLYLPGSVVKAVSYLTKNQEFGLVYGEGYHIADDGRIIERYPTEPYNSKRLGDTCYICQPTTFIRRSVVEEIGSIDESLRFCMYYDFWIRISKRYRLGYLSEYLANSRLHEQCKTVKEGVARSREALDMLYRHYRSVPPLKVGGYACAILEPRLNRSGIWNKIVSTIGMVAICSREFVRYNIRMPLSEIRRWSSGIVEGISRFNKRPR